ncbi:GIY-YIG nuclease family protein [Metamycoplasma hyosynoviae]|uniref:GIY-YIG nuclease family protein n=2 Tax=Metamycoplasma hyosynoviae TaxID=29559 RepID=UPI002359EE55|nr:GIY-YIG nuclease family protein [Metamycoplasma hyosynoviae]MDC8901267.1 GIY-YIG nuclease family protein [Metamycoplasma hyosynoviae]MDC8911818.1 GIY-YIG nuclease family protein [Metamycoplasma hyosynoviae]MDC8912509.1 GIY-YIG nuclease family protein [Metamycoplasma hyosynoviae]MDC8913081.1 GIY-YIG nuclease family protein [Metamycoplasma hyosynoviae]MDC8915117.1 GIY-YIG nuclease family protein [Metamycoplasma hyosynoviae]
MIDKTIINNISEESGVYLWKDSEGNVLYVGKAKNLKKRLSQYFNKNMLNSYKTPKLMEHASSVETLICNSDREAFIQERKLILKYRPFYNVIIPPKLTFPFIRIKLIKNGIEIKRVDYYSKENNTIFFGPLPNNRNISSLIKYLEHILISKNGEYIKSTNAEFWQNQFDYAKQIIKKPHNLFVLLQQKIEDAKKNLDFELAKFYKDVYETFSYNQAMQKTFIQTKKNINVIGWYKHNNYLLLSVIFYNDGIWFLQKDFTYQILSSPENTINEFLNSFYAKFELPEMILLDKACKDFEYDLAENIVFSETKSLEDFIEIANKNAENNYREKINKYISTNNLLKVQDKLSKLLNVDCSRIAIFDNSFFVNSETVVGMVCVFENGEHNQKLSRHFYHKVNYNRNADVEYMFWTIKKYLMKFSDVPSVLFIDGSKMQIDAAVEARNLLGLNIPIFGLSKNERHQTEKMLDEKGKEISFEDTEIFNFLSDCQYIVDKYAKYYYNKQEIKNERYNFLLDIEGVGLKTLEKLIKHFQTYENIKSATYEELCKVVNKNIALNLTKAKK